MDWATFFENNSQSLFTLAGVFLGSFITFLISYINNKFQAKERDKDRDENRREAKTQLAVELLRDDIKIIEDSINNTLGAMYIIGEIRGKKELRQQSDSEMIEEILAAVFEENGKLSKFGNLDMIADKLAYSLGEEFFLEYDKFDEHWSKYVELQITPSSFSSEDADKLKENVTRTAGKLHVMLSERLISLRDT